MLLPHEWCYLLAFACWALMIVLRLAATHGSDCWRRLSWLPAGAAVFFLFAAFYLGS